MCSGHALIIARHLNVQWSCSNYSIHLQCGKPFTPDDITILYGTEEDIQRQTERMEERRQQEKMAKVLVFQCVCVSVALLHSALHT